MTTPTERMVSRDTPIGHVLSDLSYETTIKFTISGVTGVLMDERTYDGLLETIRILQENPTILQSLNEREIGEFIDEDDVLKYV